MAALQLPTTVAVYRPIFTPKPAKSTVETVLTVLHAGGKFGDGGYKVSGGLHGVGVSVVNALSRKLHITVWRDGKQWEQDYAFGAPLGDLKSTGKTTKLGTADHFLRRRYDFPRINQV